MNYREIIAANPGATDEQILALCQSDPRTVRPIRLDELRPLLAGKGILGRLAMAAMQSPDAANAYAYIMSANETIRSDADYAPMLEAALAGLVMLGLSDTDRADIIALGGGYAVRDATLDQIANERAALATLAADKVFADAKEALRRKLQTAFNERINEIDAMTENVPTTMAITLE